MDIIFSRLKHEKIYATTAVATLQYKIILFVGAGLVPAQEKEREVQKYSEVFRCGIPQSINGIAEQFS